MTVSRLGLNHPALATAGGSALWTLINTIYQVLGDAVPGRYLTASGVANAATVTLTHGYGAAFSEYRYALYSASGGVLGSRLFTGWSVVANATNPLTQVDVTNNSGSTSDIVLVLLHNGGNTNYTYMDFQQLSATPAVPAAGFQRLYPKADGNLYSLNSAGFEQLIGAGGSGSKNYLSKSSSTATGWTATGTATVTTSTTTANLPEPSVGTGILFTLGTAGNYSYARWTLDPADYNSPRIILKAAIKALSSYASGNAKIEVYSNTAANYSGTSTRLGLSTDVSAVSGISTAQNYLGFYDNPGSTAPYMELRIVTVTATGTLCMSSISTGPGQAVQSAGIGPWTVYTPTVAGIAGSASTSSGQWRRVGDSIEITGLVIKDATAASGSTSTTISLPAGFTVNTTALASASLANEGNNIGSALYESSTQQRLISAFPQASGTIAFLNNPGTSATFNSGLFEASAKIAFRVTVPVNELAGAVTNLGQNAVEYAFSTATVTTAGGTDLTSFGYGPQGVFFNSVDSTTTGNVTTYRVRFLSPIQPTDVIQIEVTGNQNVNQWGPTSLNVLTNRVIQNAFLYGMGWAPVSGSQTDIDIQFYNGGRNTSGSTYGSAGSTWASINDGISRWRLKKSSGGVATGFGAYLPPSAANPSGFSGLIPASGLPARTDGNAIPAGNVGTFLTAAIATTANGSVQQIGSKTLPTGNWLIYAAAYVNVNAGTTLSASSNLHFLLSAASASTTPLLGAGFDDQFLFIPNAITQATARFNFSIAAVPFTSIPGQDTVFVNAQASYTGTAPNWVGQLIAVRQ